MRFGFKQRATGMRKQAVLIKVWFHPSLAYHCPGSSLSPRVVQEASCVRSLSRKQASSLAATRAPVFSFPNMRLLGKFQSLGVCCLYSLIVKDRETKGASLECHNCCWMVPLTPVHIAICWFSLHTHS